MKPVAPVNELRVSICPIPDKVPDVNSTLPVPSIRVRLLVRLIAPVPPIVTGLSQTMSVKLPTEVNVISALLSMVPTRLKSAALPWLTIPSIVRSVNVGEVPPMISMVAVPSDRKVPPINIGASVQRDHGSSFRNDQCVIVVDVTQRR